MGKFGDELTFVSSDKEVRKLDFFFFLSDSNLLYEFIKECASETDILKSVAIKATA